MSSPSPGTDFSLSPDHDLRVSAKKRKGDRLKSVPGRISIAVAIAALVFAASCDRPTPTNVLLITLDTLRDDHCSSSGYETPDDTPISEDACEPSGRADGAWPTLPTSTTGPTHASIFTSLYPIAHGVIKNGLSLEFRASPPWPGPCANADTTRQPWSARSCWTRSSATASGFDFYDDDFDPRGDLTPTQEIRGTRRRGRLRPAGRRRPREKRPGAAGTARERRDRPFFLFVHYFDPHAPYDAPQESWAEKLPSRPTSGRGLARARQSTPTTPRSPTPIDAVGALLDRLREQRPGSATPWSS